MALMYISGFGGAAGSGVEGLGSVCSSTSSSKPSSVLPWSLGVFYNVKI